MEREPSVYWNARRLKRSGCLRRDCASLAGALVVTARQHGSRFYTEGKEPHSVLVSVEHRCKMLVAVNAVGMSAASVVQGSLVGGVEFPTKKHVVS